tara:strand:+ start:503 stop:643 length:141 start_codon:yes stop_codon:yes gene_type:complete
MSKEKPITSDLFAVETCYHCNGEGQIEVADNITEDCDICNGSGMII